MDIGEPQIEWDVPAPIDVPGPPEEPVAEPEPAAPEREPEEVPA